VRVLGRMMTGGKERRLFPLTAERAKPTVAFAGQYRITGFVPSNFITDTDRGGTTGARRKSSWSLAPPCTRPRRPAAPPKFAA